MSSKKPNTPLPRNWAGLSRRYGINGLGGAWDTVLEAYYDDKLESAQAGARSLGNLPSGEASINRMIEAEYVARQRSETIALNQHINLEHPKDVDLKKLGEQILDAIKDVQQRLNTYEAFPTLVTFLPEDVDSPWTPGRHGYMMDKVPFDKICMPAHLIEKPKALAATVRHEYTHVITLNLSMGTIPPWLDEAAAMTLDGSRNPGYPRKLQQGKVPWMSPEKLDQCFQGDRLTKEELILVRTAYDQAQAIGNYISSLKGEAVFADLIRGFGNNSTWQELKMRVIGQTHADEALQEVFQISTQELFQTVEKNVKSMN